MMHATADEPIGPYYSTFPEDREARLPSGARVVGGQLEVIEELARGGMAIVYRAVDHQRGGKEVALKVVIADADPREMAARFRNEARLAASLASHPNVVRPLQVGELDGPEGFEGRTYLVTELVPGVSLDRVLVRHRIGLPMRRACTIARDVAHALVELHVRGIVHRDVKPGNIVVTGKDDEERVWLIDFGLAFATGDGWENRSPDLTVDGHAPGTPLYMSPQQVAHMRPTPAFDVYALGVMLYELFSGCPPHDGVTLGVLLARKCDPQGAPFPIGKLCPELPAQVADLVGHCMSYEPSERPTAADVVGVLDEVLLDEVPVAAASAPAPAPARLRGWVLASGVALAVAAGVATLPLWPSTHPSEDALTTVTEPSALASGAYADAGPKVDSDDAKAILPEAVVVPVESDPPASTSAAEPEQPRPLPSKSAKPFRSKPSPIVETDIDPCPENVRAAREAKAQGDWSQVLRLTSKSKCWTTSAEERTKLRTKALFETNRYAECAKQGQGSSDGNIARLAAICKARAEEQGTTP